ncbi:MAG TPA: arsenite methyltransferase [Acidobacteriota bacterium]|nr:arsenite methyltransferase [Acidobacteriota bacterium]HQM63262.1 arsenite methyltransferase [Acidobacteriota bacterium]
MDKKKDIRDMVQQAYASVARQQSGCCCGPQSCCGSPAAAPTESGLPQADLGLSCGDPVTFAAVRPGDVVVDLGSGAGRDVFIAARIVGASGRVIGVDMTDDMLALARRNAAQFAAATGLANVEFRKGFIEALPAGDAEVDVVISNCVINLSPDKAVVFREVFRVLKPGGRMTVSDIVLNRDLPPALRNNDALYAGCIAGALRREDYLAAIRSAGFAQVEILNDVTYTAGGSITDPVTREVGDELAGVASSLTIRAVKA